MVWLIPIPATAVPVDLPVDSEVDRFIIGALFMLWLAVAAVAGPYGPKSAVKPDQPGGTAVPRPRPQA